MAIFYKTDVLKRLKEAGYSTARLRDEKVLSESVIQNLRNGRGISFDSLSKICEILGKQPSDILGYIDDDTNAYVRSVDAVIRAIDDLMSTAGRLGWNKTNIAERLLKTVSAYTSRVYLEK